MIRLENVGGVWEDQCYRLWFEEVLVFISAPKAVREAGYKKVAFYEYRSPDTEYRSIIYPEEGFSPELGKEYHCFVSRLGNPGERGQELMFNGVSYDIARAILHEGKQRTVEASVHSPFAALRGVKVETYYVEARKCRYGIQLSPLYIVGDPDFDGHNTMYFLTPSEEIPLKKGVKYKVRIESKASQGCYNRKGALMVNCKVSIVR